MNSNGGKKRGERIEIVLTPLDRTDAGELIDIIDQVSVPARSAERIVALRGKLRLIRDGVHVAGEAER